MYALLKYHMCKLETVQIIDMSYANNLAQRMNKMIDWTDWLIDLLKDSVIYTNSLAWNKTLYIWHIQRNWKLMLNYME